MFAILTDHFLQSKVVLPFLTCFVLLSPVLFLCVFGIYFFSLLCVFPFGYVQHFVAVPSVCCFFHFYTSHVDGNPPE